MTSRREFLGMAAAFGGARLFAAVPGSCLKGEPNLRFGVLSDLHIQVMTGDRGYCGGPEAFEHTLRYFDSRKVDAVMIAGDLSDLGLGDELVLVGKTWDKVFPNDRAADGRKVEKLFITGNHESGVFQWNGNLARMRKRFADDAALRRQLLQCDFAGWWEKAFHEPYERFYHRNVKGYDFLCAHWDDGTPLDGRPLEDYHGEASRETFGVELKAWLAANGAKIDSKKPFFYQQHRALWKSNFGDWAWNHDKGLATEVLKAWPNAVAFAGDTHYSLTDERAIWQGPFTSLCTSSLRYSGMPYDSRGEASFENTPAKYAFRARYDGLKTMGDYNPADSKQGMVVSVYDDCLVIERREFVDDQPTGDDWVVPFGSDTPFAFEPRAKAAKAPEFAAGAKLVLSRVKAKTRGDAKTPATMKDAVRLAIPATELKAGRSRCIEYLVTAVGADGKTADFHVLAEGFDRHPRHKRARGETPFTVSLDRLPKKTIRFDVYPLDCWWNRGAPLKVDFV